MFHGSLPDKAQRILCEIVRKWDVQDIYIGCSGNFTIERVLHNCVDAKLHSNDVTIYSCLLGRYFTGQPLNAKVRDDYDGPMKFVSKYMDDDAGIISVMLILSKMTMLFKEKSNPYYEKMIRAYISQFDSLYEKTRAKISKIEPFVASLYEGDVCKWVDEVPKDAGFICYPPFFSGDYEKMFAAIERVIEWNPPVYDMINKDRILEMFRKLANRKYFMFGTNDHLEEFADHLVGFAQTTNRGTPIYIYATSDRSIITVPRQSVKPPMIPRLGPEDDIGNTMRITKISSENFHALRSKYMNININPGQESIALAVTVDGKLIGVYALSAAPTLSDITKYIDTPTIYLLSDFPVAPSKYKRLAKLVLYAALSKESHEIAQAISRKRIYTLNTTAFTRRQVSMKYRGLFRLLNKKQMKGTDENETDISKKYYGNGYQLNYGAPIGQWTLQEGLKLWKEKHGKALR